MEGKKKMKLYFGNTVTTVTTIMIVSLIVMITYSFIQRECIQFWGRRTLLLAVYGLVVCCFAAARDGLDKTIQNAIDGSCAPGVFSLVSIPTIIGCIGAALIIVAVIATPIAWSQQVKQVCFFIMSGGITLKIVTMEIARIIMAVK